MIDPELVERLKKGIPALALAGIIMSGLLGSDD